MDKTQSSRCFGGNNTAGEIDVATAVNAHGGAGRMDFESETFVATGQGYWDESEVAATLGAALDASYGRLQGASGQDANHGHSHLIPTVAFSCKDHGADAGDLAPTLRAMGHEGSHANGGGQVAIAFTERGREQGRTFECQEETAYCLTNPGSGGRTHSRSLMDPKMAVRRLTPTECERLQGFPDGYTAIPHRGKPAADGPRYKALGNSWAVPCVEWIFERMDAVEKLIAERE